MHRPNICSICMHWQHHVCVFEKVPPSNHMHGVARNREAFRKSMPGRMELVNPLASTPVRGFTGIYIYIYILVDNLVHYGVRARKPKSSL